MDEPIVAIFERMQQQCRPGEYLVLVRITPVIERRFFDSGSLSDWLTSMLEEACRTDEEE